MSTDSRAQLQTLLSQGARKVIITTIHKFGEAPGVLDDRAQHHRDGRRGAPFAGGRLRAEDARGAAQRVPLRPDRHADQQARPQHVHVVRVARGRGRLPVPLLVPGLHPRRRHPAAALRAALVGAAHRPGGDRHRVRGTRSRGRDLTEADKITLSKKAASIEVLIKTPSRIAKIAADIADHFRAKVEPQGFKAQVVVYDKASCVAYKEELDKHLGPDVSTIVMSKSRGDSPDWAKWTPGAEALEQVVARFNDPADPLKIIIVTAKLLTGFDAPILHCQYLDKPLKEHTLLQAITRTNRVYPPNKTHGLIVDYLGIFDDVAKSLAFDEKSVQQLISNIEELKKQLAPAMAAALAFFPGVDRTVGGYEGLVQAQSAIADDEAKDAFGLAYSVVSQLWEALSPDPMLAPVSR